MDPEEEITVLRRKNDQYRAVLYEVCVLLERICSPDHKLLLKVKEALGYRA